MHSGGASSLGLLTLSEAPVCVVRVRSRLSAKVCALLCWFLWLLSVSADPLWGLSGCGSMNLFGVRNSEYLSLSECSEI